jgi:23S rRNA (cytidine1920-2'-O)/16S rRNA (cytidine1409-2'-O)-methyltransferase
MSKTRLDNLLVEKSLAPSRAKAQAIILAGEVYVAGARAEKAGQLVNESAKIEIKKTRPDYVSRGGGKLAHALKEFSVDVTGLVSVDIGASTGGFTDCLLKNGAKKVYAIDVGYGQLDYSLRKDERVIVFERTNIRDLDTKKIEDPVDLVVIDVSFIGLEKVFPKVDELKPGRIIALIKPQFQVGKGKVGKGGVVRDEGLRQEAIESVKTAASEYNWKFQGITESPIKGPKGNIEYLACWHAKCGT